MEVSWNRIPPNHPFHFRIFHSKGVPHNDGTTFYHGSELSLHLTLDMGNFATECQEIIIKIKITIQGIIHVVWANLNILSKTVFPWCSYVRVSRVYNNHSLQILDAPMIRICSYFVYTNWYIYILYIYILYIYTIFPWFKQYTISKPSFWSTKPSRSQRKSGASR
jgi:hypothetical protein